MIEGYLVGSDRHGTRSLNMKEEEASILYVLRDYPALHCKEMDVPEEKVSWYSEYK